MELCEIRKSIGDLQLNEGTISILVSMAKKFVIAYARAAVVVDTDEEDIFSFADIAFGDIRINQKCRLLQIQMVLQFMYRNLNEDRIESIANKPTNSNFL